MGSVGKGPLFADCMSEVKAMRKGSPPPIHSKADLFFANFCTLANAFHLTSISIITFLTKYKSTCTSRKVIAVPTEISGRQVNPKPAKMKAFVSIYLFEFNT